MAPSWGYRRAHGAVKKDVQTTTWRALGAIALSCPTTTNQPSYAQLLSLTLSYNYQGFVRDNGMNNPPVSVAEFCDSNPRLDGIFVGLTRGDFCGVSASFGIRNCAFGD